MQLLDIVLNIIIDGIILLSPMCGVSKEIVLVAVLERY